MDMKGKVFIVAGGGRDIGRSCALALAKRGASILLTYHASADAAHEVVAEIERSGAKAVALKADLTQESEANGVVAAAINAFGHINGLVHVSGGLIERITIDAMPLQHWRKVMDVNLTSLFMMVRATIPHLNAGDSIVTFASQAGRDGGGSGAVAYATSKGAIMSFTRGLAKELGAKNIRVNSVCPGMISTGFHDQFTQSDVRSKVAAATALKREGTADEVGQLVAFLMSREASFMTGNCIDINGGLLFS
ncbi:SDR family NAD(P)-dependent oxidoreductase [Cellvibrio sp. PSBB023]|uniref:SDR family NAD(P)-dependent oxidoreductase n=1 Tax=Cellvibrio sp. PSBB023 TaxID=1945512 RepID=UPI00098FAF90|nr:SDR family NAD(P)-dependent oxidoreductase [Cellvibrio sp. PSBB023]AQT59016.1 oxidoreductase [Cellvibrio sp. PSBB023]